MIELRRVAPGTPRLGRPYLARGQGVAERRTQPLVRGRCGVKPWKGDRNATSETIACYQELAINQRVIWQMIDDFWTQRMGDAPPIAHCFRDVFRNRWVRFHSLADSKRYAEPESEWGTLLERHNAVVAQLTSDGSQLELLTTSWSASNTPDSPVAELRKLNLPADYWRTGLDFLITRLRFAMHSV